MSQPDRLFSIDEINQLIQVTKAAKEIAYLCQLRDVMRDNERLLEALLKKPTEIHVEIPNKHSSPALKRCDDPECHCRYLIPDRKDFTTQNRSPCDLCGKSVDIQDCSETNDGMHLVTAINPTKT